MSNKIDYGYHYKKWHSETPEHLRGMILFYRNMLSGILPADKSISILDVGCGMGFALATLKEMGYSNIEGIDVDKGQVNACLSKGIKCTQVDDSIAYLIARKDKYDLIISLDVFEHVPFDAQLPFVVAVQAAIKPGGKVICTVPNASSTLASRWRYIDWTHHTSFTEHSLDFLLYNAGFRDPKVYETEFFRTPSIKSMLRIKPLIHWCLFLLVRGVRRMQMIAELGLEQGKQIPLSLNILATAIKPL